MNLEDYQIHNPQSIWPLIDKLESLEQNLNTIEIDHKSPGVCIEIESLDRFNNVCRDIKNEVKEYLDDN